MANLRSIRKLLVVSLLPIPCTLIAPACAFSCVNGMITIDENKAFSTLELPLYLSLIFAFVIPVFQFIIASQNGSSPPKGLFRYFLQRPLLFFLSGILCYCAATWVAAKVPGIVASATIEASLTIGSTAILAIFALTGVVCCVTFLLALGARFKKMSISLVGRPLRDACIFISILFVSLLLIAIPYHFPLESTGIWESLQKPLKVRQVSRKDELLRQLRERGAPSV